MRRSLTDGNPWTRLGIRKIVRTQGDGHLRGVGALTDRLQKGEAADVVIVSGPQIDELQKSGKVVAGSRVDIAKVGIGVFVRKGAAKPDISSADAFKRSMLAAKAIDYTNPASGAADGIYLASLFDRLGIAAEMKAKTKHTP